MRRSVHRFPWTRSSRSFASAFERSAKAIVVPVGRPLLIGLSIGLVVAMPVGPMSALCIRRTLLEGRRSGLAVGCGIAAADGLYASVVAFGLTAVSRPLLTFAPQLEVAGGLVLVALGAAGMLSPPAAAQDPAEPAGAARTAGSALLLTLTNPATLVVFTALFVAGALPTYAGFATAALVVLGAFTGSLVWWVVLTAVVAALRARLSAGALRALNVASGAAILIFGLAAVWAATVGHA